MKTLFTTSIYYCNIVVVSFFFDVRWVSQKCEYKIMKFIKSKIYVEFVCELPRENSQFFASTLSVKKCR